MQKFQRYRYHRFPHLQRQPLRHLQRLNGRRHRLLLVLLLTL